MMQRTIALGLGAAFGAIGIGAVAAPRISAAQYGLPTKHPTGLALVRAMGARDLAIGGMLIANRDDRPALARICYWSTIVALVDAAMVAAVHGARPHLAIHLTGAVALIAAGNALRQPHE